VDRGRILVYVQSLVGIGHLAAARRIAEALLAFVDVDFVHGGLGDTPAVAHPGWRALRLPTLLHDEVSGVVYDPDHGRAPDDVWADRRRALDAFVAPPYRAVLVEFWPFGRRRFKDEIRRLLAVAGGAPVFTSVREVLVPRPAEVERRMVADVRRHVHTVFVRGDAALLRLDETFGAAPEIADRIVYTGYLATPVPATDAAREPLVLVSQGGGDVGLALLQAALGAAARLPRLRFVLAAGARTPAATLAALRRDAGTNVEVVPFIDDFPRALAGAALSINMGGDNTLAEVVAARTPSLAWPYPGNPEQAHRVRRFAECGLVHALEAAEFAPARLAARIEGALRAGPPTRPLAIDGARVTAAHIAARLGR
jgi:predicted glycosyltransferase